MSTCSAKDRYRFRVRRIIEGILDNFELDLSDLVILTEAASGSYVHNPILTALAGAKEVIAVTRDSRFSTGVDVAKRTLEEAKCFGVEDRIRVVFDKTRESISKADIVTNTGFVRPIDSQLVSWMKSTAVVSLMWETWEFREEEVALDACKDAGILVLGTNESIAPLSMDSYAGMLALKLLFDLGLEGYRAKVILVGGGRLGKRVFSCFTDWGVRCQWFAEDESGARPLSDLRGFWGAEGHEFDAILLAELKLSRQLLGRAGLVSFGELAGINPDLRIGIIAGVVDHGELTPSGLKYVPEQLTAPGYMGYQLYDMGPRPILELFAGGLKVGQVMARSRLAGLDVRETAAHALRHSPAMDFEGELAWL